MTTPRRERQRRARLIQPADDQARRVRTVPRRSLVAAAASRT